MPAHDVVGNVGDIVVHLRLVDLLVRMEEPHPARPAVVLLPLVQVRLVLDQAQVQLVVVDGPRAVARHYPPLEVALDVHRVVPGVGHVPERGEA